MPYKCNLLDGICANEIVVVSFDLLSVAFVVQLTFHSDQAGVLVTSERIRHIISLAATISVSE